MLRLYKAIWLVLALVFIQSTYAAQKPLAPVDFIIFGGNGDLAQRKLIPSLYELYYKGYLNKDFRIIGVSRSDISLEDYHELLNTIAIDESKKLVPLDKWDSFLKAVEYISVDATKLEDYADLAKLVNQKQDAVRVYYMATASFIFAHAAENLNKLGLIHDKTRFVTEKPFGHSVESSLQLNNTLKQYIDDEKIYRVDHYLAKEPIQNIMTIRFENPLFEALWDKEHIAHIEISALETLGVEERADYYDKVGALNDMVQSHLLQVLAYVTMERPTTFTPKEIRSKKAAVLSDIDMNTTENFEQNIIFGQYHNTNTEDEESKSYLEESGVAANSTTDTYFAGLLGIDNPRWQGVPIFIRSGKKLKERVAEVIVYFKSSKPSKGNKLVIRIQPNPTIRLFAYTKKPGTDDEVIESYLELASMQSDEKSIKNAYAKILYDAMLGDLSMFVSIDEITASWAWADKINNLKKARNHKPKPYEPSSYGPLEANCLMQNHQGQWHHGHGLCPM